MMKAVFDIDPVAKPRMTRKDVFKKPPRPCVARYFAYRDEVGYRRVSMPTHSYHVIFVIAMPKSWSQQKRSAMAGQPHTGPLDKDNLEKGLLDAVFRTSDAAVWDGRVSKIWGRRGQIVVLTNSATAPPLDTTFLKELGTCTNNSEP